MAAAVRPRSFLSTPSARRATITDRAVRYLQTISIHALREEGDVCAIYDISELISFLSTPSARRATERSGPQEAQEAISIHALREEGDPRRQHRRPAGLKISIHALREEGDASIQPISPPLRYFYPRPPRGGRQRDVCKRYPDG